MSSTLDYFSFKFLNEFGVELKTVRRILQPGFNEISFDVSDLPSGLYLIMPVTNNAKVVPMKFVKL